MKKLIVTAVLLVGLSTFAQEPATNPRREKLEQMTPQQKNELRLKKLTLDLGLNASQQKEMGKIIAEMEAKREAFKAERLAKKEAGTKPTKDERFAMKTKLLDEQIATKERVKKILDANQFEKWEKMQDQRMEKMNKFSEQKRDRRTFEK
jgi:selenocysteine-specific translation elongation factor